MVVNTIHEAGRSRKLLYIEAVEEDGSVEPREVEPYSFRTTKEGNTLFYGWDVAKGSIRSFRLERIRSVRITNKSFNPRFPIEL